jgi:hypothetical protein
MDSATGAAVDVNWRKCGANVGKLSKLAALWLAVEMGRLLAAETPLWTHRRSLFSRPLPF